MRNPLLQRKEIIGRVFRGGSWYYSAEDSRVSFRDGDYASRRHILLGFRLFRTKGKA